MAGDPSRIRRVGEAARGHRSVVHGLPGREKAGAAASPTRVTAAPVSEEGGEGTDSVASGHVPSPLDQLDADELESLRWHWDIYEITVAGGIWTARHRTSPGGELIATTAANLRTLIRADHCTRRQVNDDTG
jgi:hypothetical protein